VPFLSMGDRADGAPPESTHFCTNVPLDSVAYCLPGGAHVCLHGGAHGVRVRARRRRRGRRPRRRGARAPRRRRRARARAARRRDDATMTAAAAAVAAVVAIAVIAPAAVGGSSTPAPNVLFILADDLVRLHLSASSRIFIGCLCLQPAAAAAACHCCIRSPASDLRAVDITPPMAAPVALWLACVQGFADLGYSSVTDEVDTPTIDGLAASGVKLGSLYTWNWCAPSRGAIMYALLVLLRLFEPGRYSRFPDPPPPCGEFPVTCAHARAYACMQDRCIRAAQRLRSRRQWRRQRLAQWGAFTLEVFARAAENPRQLPNPRRWEVAYGVLR
jgi:hypothetical protein